MTSERWRQIEELYLAATACEPEGRAVFLDGACGPDTELRQEVESLLARDAQLGSFLESHSSETASISVPRGQFGPYRIIGPLGSGGMGEVYRAHDSKLGRDVALKTLPSAFANHPDRLARFRREARMLASLNHPNIAAIYGLEESEDAICLVLELVEGATLAGPLPIERALDYARQGAEALETAHARGIIHRDLKPVNVKVTPEGRVKIQSTVTVFQTVAGQIAGTPPYMSP